MKKAVKIIIFIFLGIMIIGVISGLLTNTNDECSQESKVKTDNKQKVDTSTLNKIKDTYFDEVNDNLDNGVYYIPKTVKLRNKVQIYYYIYHANNGESSLRFKINYNGTKHIYFKTITFKCKLARLDDVVTFDYTPEKPITYTYDGANILETVDIEVSTKYMQTSALVLIFEAIPTEIDVILSGDNYTCEYTLTQEQVYDIVRSITLFGGLGGEIQ